MRKSFKFGIKIVHFEQTKYTNKPIDFQIGLFSLFINNKERHLFFFERDYNNSWGLELFYVLRIKRKLVPIVGTETEEKYFLKRPELEEGDTVLHKKSKREYKVIRKMTDIYCECVPVLPTEVEKLGSVSYFMDKINLEKVGDK